MSIKGTKTEKNLLTAFIGESQARNKYTYFASQAGKEGFVQIAAVFEETANQEKEHAKRLFKLLEGGPVAIQASFPAGVIGDTAANLEEAAGGENFEWTAMYPEYAQTAREEGFPQIAAILEAIAVAEKQHDARYRGLLENVRRGRVFAKSQPIRWRCRNCGFVHEGTAAPEVCPACAHPQAYFEVMAENW